MKEDILIIGLTGENSGGKGTIASFITDHYKNYSTLNANTRERILDIARGCNVDLSDRPALSKFSDEYAERYGGAVYCEAFYTQAQLHKHRILIIDSVRRVDEVRFIHKNNGLVISVTADASARFFWAQKRGTVTDKIKTLEDFIDMDYKEASAEPWGLNLAETMKLADVHLVNEDSKEHFIEKLRQSLTPFIDAKLQRKTFSFQGGHGPGHGTC